MKTTYQRSSSFPAVLLRVPMVVEILRPNATRTHNSRRSSKSSTFRNDNDVEKEMEMEQDMEMCEASLFLEMEPDIELAAASAAPRAAPILRRLSTSSFASSTSASCSVNKTDAAADAACPCAAVAAKLAETNKSSSQSTTSLCKLVFGAAGVYFSYMLYGHYQEDLFVYKSAALDGAKFRHAWFLQTLESLGSASLGYMAKRRFDNINNNKSSNNNKNNNNNNRSSSALSSLPLMHFFTSGAAQVCAKGFTSLALAAGLSFPVCILAKSAKMIPVMLGQLVLGGSSYRITDYGMAALIVSGATLLSMGDSKNSSSSSSTNNSTIMGVLLILLSLFMDGITAGLQKRLKHQLAVAPHQQQATTFDFMLYTSLSMFITALLVAVVTDDLRTGYQYVLLNPGTLQHTLAMVCLCSVIGQFFVFYLVAQFDPLVCSTVTTTRKISSVAWSIHAKGHVLSRQGFIGLALATAGIALELRNKCNIVGTTTTTTIPNKSLTILPVSSNGTTTTKTDVGKTPFSSRRSTSMATTDCTSSTNTEDSEDE